MSTVLNPSLLLVPATEFVDSQTEFQSPNLELANVTVTAQLLATLLTSKTLLSLKFSNCSFDLNFDLLTHTSLSLTKLSIYNSIFHSQISLKFCPYLQTLKIVSCSLERIHLNGAFLRSAVLDFNRLAHIGGGLLPKLTSLSAEGNRLECAAFLARFPLLRSGNLAGNRLQTLKISPIETPNLQRLNVAGNALPLPQFRALAPFRNLVALECDVPAAVDLKVARALVLGEFFARTDEVANAVGTNQFQERFPACASFDKQIFEGRKKEAIQSVSAPAESVLGVLRLLLRQVFFINGRAADSGAVARCREWICPVESVLGVGQCQVYE
ncbi:Leucine-rich repeat protein [Spironucleus salmonicida]|uniref:Leucine-rich repeat protein n=1 Tax=Spironucleus salmonicida TaxID=348837 RepID=A0A9P8RZQ9_9EUKA|nr:Leucine-rich repeat protein [Spironucleus salmonicida]